MRRKPAKRGLSYYDANRDRLVTVEDDVLGVKSQIESTWPELTVFFDDVDEEWVVVESCRDGVERLALSTPVLNEQVFERLQKVAFGDLDILEEVDAWNERLKKNQEREFDDKLGEAVERMEFALRKDGVISQNKIFVSKGARRGN